MLSEVSPASLAQWEQSKKPYRMHCTSFALYRAHQRIAVLTKECFNTLDHRSARGTSSLSWLKPGPVCLKRHIRNKNELLVDKAELLESTHLCAHSVENRK